MKLREFIEMLEDCGGDAEIVICDGEVGRDEQQVKRLFICRDGKKENEQIILKV